MSLRTIKLVQKVRASGASLLNQFTPTFGGFIISWAVSKFLSIELWGEFAYASMLINLLLSVCGYGSKDFVLQRISLQPSQRKAIWSSDFTSRLILLPLVVLLIFLTGYSFHLKVLLAVWILFGYVNKSFESLQSYDRQFLNSALLDISVYLLLFFYILFFKNLTLAELIKAQIILHGVRSVYWIALYSDSFHLTFFQFKSTHFRQAFFFFMPQLIGFIGSRADFLVSMPLLEKSELGKYQLLSGFLILFQGVIAGVLSPYLKNIYRLPITVVKKWSLSIFAVGSPLLILYLAVISLVLRHIYDLEYGSGIFAVAMLQGIPYLLYVLYYSRLFGARPALISIVHAIGIAVAIIVGVLLIPRFGMKGALFANTASQWSIAALIFSSLYYIERKARSDFHKTN